MGAYVGPPRMRPFSRYLDAREREYREGLLYRAYVTESLRLAPQGKFIGRSFADALSRLGKPAETRTGREIADEVIDRMGLEVTG